jgi:inosine/xanthosine triphosphatase
MERMQIALGSTNPVKQAAVKNVLSLVFEDAQISSFEVPSGVQEQPIGDAETRQGAYNRAKAVLDLTDAEIGVGLEGGVIETEFGLMTCAWCVILRQDGTVGIGGGSHMMLPDSVASAIRSGIELGLAMDRLVGEKNTKHKEGAIGILTTGLLNRRQAYENIIRLAAAPFRSPNFYIGV